MLDWLHKGKARHFAGPSSALSNTHWCFLRPPPTLRKYYTPADSISDRFNAQTSPLVSVLLFHERTSEAL